MFRTTGTTSTPATLRPWEIPDSPLEGVVWRLAKEQHFAAVGFDDVQEHAYGGGLACAVRSHQAEHLTAMHCERDVTNDLSVAERLGDVLYGDRFRTLYTRNAMLLDGKCGL